MRGKKRKKRVVALLIAVMFMFSIIDWSIVVKAEDNIQISLKPQYNADIVLTVEDSKVDPSNFEKDLKSKLNSLGIKDSRIKITGLKAQEVNAQDTFAWNVYDHKGNWGEYNYPNGDGKPNPSDNQHILVKNNGKNITFYGYGRPSYKDFMFMANGEASKKSFEFELNETAVNYHSMEGAGFLFNSKIENNKLSGYCLLLAESGVLLYKIDGIDVKQFHDAENARMNGYKGITLVNSFQKDSLKNHKIKIETSTSKISMWDNNKQIINNFSLDKEYGNGFGPIASYVAHDCNKLSYFTFNSLTMTTTKTTKFKDLIRKPQWDMNSKKFVVNLNDTSDEDFKNTNTLGEILCRITSENIDYIGWGTAENKVEAEDLIAKNNQNGAFIDNKDYSDSIDIIGKYICDKLKQTSEGETKVIIGQPLQVDVNPSNLKENTANKDYPLGSWKIDHDEKYYENDMGKSTFNGQYMDSLNMNLEKPGKYDISFRDSGVVPKTVYAHRIPTADFETKINKNNGEYTLSINDKSYDEDRKSQGCKGILEELWQWRELTSSQWNEGKIPEKLEGNKEFIVQLKVKDYDGAWSNPMVKYISTKEDQDVKPIATFSISPEILYTPVVKDVAIVDSSYDPKGSEITERQWTVERDGKIIYTGNEPKTEFSNLGSGQYTISLKVKSSQWSESFSRIFNLRNLQEEIDKVIGDVAVGYSVGDNANSVTKDVVLPSKTSNDTIVRWQSDCSSIDKYGNVTRPIFSQGDSTVNLTANLYNNGLTAKKDFKLVVKALPNTLPTIKDILKDGFIDSKITFEEKDFTMNYSDLDGDTEKAIEINTLPSNGKLLYDNKEIKIKDEIKLSDIKKLTLEPDKGFAGIIQFSYRASDGYGYSPLGKITVNIKDNVPPMVDVVSIKTNNGSDSSYGKMGDTISLTFTLNEALGDNPKVLILGKDAAVNKVNENSYEATYNINDKDKEGIVDFTLSNIKDKYNNEAKEVKTTTDGTFVTIDNTVPSISNIKDKAVYKEDVIPEFSEGTGTIDGKPYIPGTPITEEGNHTFVVKDKAGNTCKITFIIDKSMPKTLDIKGKVYYGNDIYPNMKLTLVDINDSYISSTVSDKDGNYSFNATKTGLYKIVTNKDGLEQTTEVNLIPTKPTDKEKIVDVYLSKYKVDMKAQPKTIVGDGLDTTKITISVLDENNKPVTDKKITLKASSGTLIDGDNKITDSDGNASFRLQSSKVNGNDMVTITVSAKVQGLDAPISKELVVQFAPGSIKGIVVDNETGLPVPEAIVEVSKDFDNNGITDFYARFVTGNDGKYKIAVPKGNVEYDVKITKKITLGTESKIVTFNQKTKTGQITGQGEESYNGLNTVTGMLLMKNPRGETTILKDYSNYSVVIVDDDGNSVTNITGQDQLEKEQGIFNFSGLEKGKTYYAAVYYKLPDGTKIKVGASKIVVNNDGELNIATCLIDPYGTITDKETGKIITGANVKLYYANTARNISKGIKAGTIVELPEVKDFPPANNLNPQSSDINGKYAWMVFPNTDYYIVAEANGYEKYTSDVISVNDEIVKHDIAMTPVKASNNSQDNSEKTNEVKKLPQTGSLISTNLLIAMGVVLIAMGAFVYHRRRLKNK